MIITGTVSWCAEAVAGWPRRYWWCWSAWKQPTLLFATDSIPAIFAVTLDPFIVYSSTVFAILGLRSLYFVLAGAINLFHYLQLGLGVVLGPSA